MISADAISIEGDHQVATGLFEAGEDRDDFFAASELYVLEHNIRNRVRSGPGEERLTSVTIDPPKSEKAYY